MNKRFEIFAACAPGLEPFLAAEVARLVPGTQQADPGGVTLTGTWEDVWRLNIRSRMASRILLRFARFPAVHLAQLDKRARKVPWADILRADVPVKVDVTARRSKIYHQGAARQRIETAIAETLGTPLSEDAAIRVMARIEDNLVTLSLDTSGEPLHRRGLKQAVGKAPLRETLACGFLAACGFDGTEPVLDPMCGSGTFPLEAAAWARGLAPGRGRAFAFEKLGAYDRDRVAALQKAAPQDVAARFEGSDRDQGVIRMAAQNAERADVADLCVFSCRPVSGLARPEGPAGLVMVNPPYGARIGQKGPLHALHASLGTALKDRFAGWRVGMVTSEPGLARATGLPFKPPGPPVPHGPLKIKLYQTGPL